MLWQFDKPGARDADYPDMAKEAGVLSPLYISTYLILFNGSHCMTCDGLL